MLAEANFSANPVTDPLVKPAVLVVFLVLLLVARRRRTAIRRVGVGCSLSCLLLTADCVVVLIRFVRVVAVAFDCPFVAALAFDYYCWLRRCY